MVSLGFRVVTLRSPPPNSEFRTHRIYVGLTYRHQIATVDDDNDFNFTDLVLIEILLSAAFIVVSTFRLMSSEFRYGSSWEFAIDCFTIVPKVRIYPIYGH